MSVLEELEQLQQRIVKRAAELRGPAQEYAELQQAAAKLGIDLDAAPAPTRAEGRSSRAAAPKRGTSRSNGAASKRSTIAVKRNTSATTKRTPGGSRQRGSRRDQVVQLVKQNPGITVAELGKKLDVNSTGLYRVVRALENAGEVKKDGRALTPTAS